MLIHPQDIKPKPFYAFAFVQGQDDTLRVTGHVSLDAAKRSASKLMREVRAAAAERPLMTWGYGEVEADERLRGIVI